MRITRPCSFESASAPCALAAFTALSPSRAARIRIVRDAAEAHHERAVLCRTIGAAVTHARAAKRCEIGVARGIDKCTGGNRRGAAVVVHVDPCDAVAGTRRAGKRRVQQYVDAGAFANAIECEFHDLGIEQRDHHVRRRAHGCDIAAERSDFAQHGLAHTAHDLYGRIGLRPKSAIGQDVTVRCSAAEIRGAFDQGDRGAGLRGGDGGGNAGRAAARNDDVVMTQRPATSWLDPS